MLYFLHVNLNVLYQYSYVRFENSKSSQKGGPIESPIAVKVITKTLFVIFNLLTSMTGTKTMVDKTIGNLTWFKSEAPNYISGKYSSLPRNFGD